VFAVNSLAVLHDGTLASGSPDKKIFAGHVNGYKTMIWSLAFLNDGSLVSGSTWGLLSGSKKKPSFNNYTNNYTLCLLSKINKKTLLQENYYFMVLTHF